jgi:hypothetical protein
VGFGGGGQTPSLRGLKSGRCSYVWARRHKHLRLNSLSGRYWRIPEPGSLKIQSFFSRNTYFPPFTLDKIFSNMDEVSPIF